MGERPIEGAVCDACAEYGPCADENGANICDRCQAFHERAIEAAAAAISHERQVSALWEDTSKAHKHACRELARVAVKAYTEYSEEAP